MLRQVVEVSGRVAGTRSRTAKTALLAAALRSVRPGQAELAASYLSGVLPQRTGIGHRSLATMPRPAAEPSLRIDEVDAALAAIAAETGAGSRSRRRARLESLLAAATAPEQAFLRALLTGGVRQGALDGLLLAAIAEAAHVPEAAVRRAVMLAGRPAHVAGVALAGGADGLAAIGLRPGRPLQPMLAAADPDVAAAMARVAAPGDRVALERKIDGIRLQAHKSEDGVGLFTRALEEVTARLPEVEALVAGLPARSLVLDAEAIVVRPDGRPEPFQVTGSRVASRGGAGRGGRAAATRPVTTYAFDLLHLDGEDLLDRPAGERFAALAALLPAGAIVPRLETADPQEAAAFFAAQVAQGHEGVVVKSLHAPYAAGRRGAGWVKVKPRHTLDLVVLAVEWGSGRRRGLLSNIHLGARGGDGFVMLGKTFKGMTDEMLAWQTERFLQLETAREGHVVHVRPEQVVEIAFDGLQRSSRYPGGLALRFARVLRYRQDKGPGEADTIETVRALAQRDA